MKYIGIVIDCMDGISEGEYVHIVMNNYKFLKGTKYEKDLDFIRGDLWGRRVYDDELKRFTKND